MSPAERVGAAYERIAAVDRPEVWIHLRGEAELLAEAEQVEARLARGEALPLVGRLVAVKDNIDLAGVPTTAGCPAYAYEPERSAPAVARLVEAGALVLGKTNLDQFATGLVGTRSPYGAVRDAHRPEFVSGGSSSGSAVAVALGIADLGLGTDTAGSGRVPAAFAGIVGAKPTRGLVPTTGVVPACRSLDCVSVFAPDIAAAEAALAVIAGPDPADPLSRPLPPDAPLAAPPVLRVGVPVPAELPGLSAEAQAAFAKAAERLGRAGAALVPLDPSPFLEAGRLLYGGAFVAERHAAVGEFVTSHRDEVDPTVGAIVAAAADPSASELFADRERLDALALRAREILGTLDAVLLPTTTRQPTIAAVEADPIGANSALGLFTNCANLLDLCALAIPAGEADGGRFGVTLMAPAFADPVLADIGRLLLGEERPAVDPSPGSAPPGSIPLFVAGAHLSGQPLNHQLTERGARLLGAVRTAPAYRLYALDTSPPKPGLVRVGDEEGGASLPGELWALSPAALGSFLAEVSGPMALGQVELHGGASVTGFLCEPRALEGARDITAAGGWVAYLEGAEPDPQGGRGSAEYVTVTAKTPVLRYLGAADVARLLPPLAAQLELVRETFAAISAGTAVAPPTTCLHPRPTGFADALPAYHEQRDLTAIKWVCGDERNAARGLPYLSGLVVLNDSDTGLPLAILEGGTITAARTAAVTAASLTALAPTGWSEVAVIGYGVQARAHLRMLRALNPAVRIRVATRRAPAETEPGVELAASPRAAVAGADVVITAIPLSARLDPPIAPGWLKAGALVLPLDDDACLDPAVVGAAGHFAVDDVERYRRDRGQGLFAGWRDPDAAVAEAIAAPPGGAGIRVCMNQGIGLMDAPFAEAVWRAAEEGDLGVALER